MKNYRFLLDLIIAIESIKNNDIARIEDEYDRIIRKAAWTNVLYEEDSLDDNEVNTIKEFVSQYVDQRLQYIFCSGAEKIDLKHKFFVLLRCRDTLLREHNKAIWNAISKALKTGHGLLSLNFYSTITFSNTTHFHDVSLTKALRNVNHIIAEFELTGLDISLKGNGFYTKDCCQELCAMLKLPSLNILTITDRALSKIMKCMEQTFCAALSQSNITRLIVKGDNLATNDLQRINPIIESNIRRKQIQTQSGLLHLTARFIWWNSNKRKRLLGESNNKLNTSQAQRCLTGTVGSSKNNISLFKWDGRNNRINNTKVPPELFPTIDINILEGFYLSKHKHE